MKFLEYTELASVPQLNPTMKVHVSLCFVLVCGVLGLLVEGAEEDRYHREFAALSEGRNIFSVDKTFMKMTMAHRRVHITFTLYTKRNQANGQEIRLNDTEKLRNSDFDADKPTRFITHGFLNDGNSPCCTLIRNVYLEWKRNTGPVLAQRRPAPVLCDVSIGHSFVPIDKRLIKFCIPIAYLARSDCNVIIVDWSRYSYKAYPFAVLKLRSIGQEVAKMINFMYERAKLRSKSTSLVGYSLGAHIMGIAGYNTKYKVNYIVGLDPALPGFITAGPERSISTQSGKHVQLIHTNGGVLGYLNAAGHSDFFPNGGKQQTGCSKVTAVCSHERSYKLFAQSITTTINGTRCKSYEAFEAGDCGTDTYVAPMGGLEPSVPPGKYYLRTGSKPPYSVK